MKAPTNSPARYLGTSFHGVTSVDREADRDRRVEVRAAELADRVHGDRDRHAPSERDHDPARVLGLGVRKQDSGDDAVAEQDQDRRPDHLGSEDFHDTPFSGKSARKNISHVDQQVNALANAVRAVLEIQTRETSTAYRSRSSRAIRSSPPIRWSSYG